MGRNLEVIPTQPVAPQPGVIPTSQVIVLKEHELDCDLATAIERIRANEDTSHSRILVVAPDDESEEKREEAAVQRAPVSVPTTVGQVARRGQEAAVEELGRKLQPLGACLEHYLEEMRAAVRELTERIPDPLPEGCAGPLRVLGEALSWSEALATDLAGQVGDAQRGFLAVDTHALAQDMAAQVEAIFPEGAGHGGALRRCRRAPASQRISPKRSSLDWCWSLSGSAARSDLGDLRKARRLLGAPSLWQG